MKPTLLNVILTNLIACLFLVSGVAAQSRQDLLQATLLADTAGVQPGRPFTLGVMLKIAPGWHVYWLNPGDSGRETTVTFRAPSGIRIGELRYPVPVKFEQPGNAIGYGYEREVLLTAEVKPPAESNGAKDVTITADVEWLCCSAESCIPGKATLSITLPVSEKASRANEKLFADWTDRFPHGKHPHVECDPWERDRAAGVFETRVMWEGKAPMRVELYPGKDEAIEVEEATAVTSDNETAVRVKARVLPGQTPSSDTLPALLVYTDEKGVRRGMNLSIPVGKSAAAATSDAP
jgi:thiol:disulfide interchange protein DsbD